MSEIILYAQADVIDVRLELHPTSSAAGLERLVMRAIDTGVDDYNTLSMYFGLTPRLMADLLGDMWTAGRVTLDLGTTPETIALSDEGRAHLADQSLGDATRPSSTTSRVLLERLTGRVLGDRSGMRSVDRRFVIPVMRDDRLARQVTVTELTEAVRQNLERGDHDLEFIDDQRIASVLPVTRTTEGGAPRLMVAIRTSVWRDGDALHVNVTDRDLPLESRERASRRLESYLRENPDTYFARNVRGVAQYIADRSRTSDDMLSELARGVQDLAAADPGVRQSEHDRLKYLANQLADQASSIADREMNVDLVIDNHEEVIGDLIRTAQRQVVFAVPRISLERLKRHQTALEEAVARGVRIFVIWGLEGSGKSLNDHLTQYFYAISRRGRGGGAVRFAAASASSHAKVVIADDRRALVTSKNVLSDSDLAEVGVLVTADDGRPAPVIEELLAWAGRTMPDYHLAQQILRAADEFGERDAMQLLSRPTIPFYEPQLSEAPVGDPRVDLWATAWKSAAAEIRASLVRRRPVVRPLRDGQHHTLLRELLQEAKHRVVVASHRIAVPVIARDLASRAGDAQTRGASVELVYGEVDARTEQSDLDRVIQDETSGAVKLREREDNHAKVLVADGVAVIGSFNYLSFNGISRRGMSSEVSLEIASADFADRVARALGSDAKMPPRLVLAAAEGADSVTLAVARKLALELSEDRLDIAGVVSALADVEVDVVLDALGSADDEMSRELILAALVASGTPEGRPGWIGELANKAAERGDWALADLFRSALEADHPEFPPRLLTNAIASEPELLCDLISELPDHLPDTDPLALHLAVQLLVGGQLVDEALRHRLDDMSTPVGTLVEAIRAHTSKYAWADRDALRAHYLRSTADENRDTAWAALGEAIIRLRNVDVRVLAGRHTIDYVFADGAEFDVVQRVAADRDADALGDWLREHEADDFAWVDQSAKAAKVTPIVGGLRERFASRRGRVREAAQDIVLAARTDVPHGRALGDGELASLRAIAELAADLVPSSATRFGAALGAQARERLSRVAELDGGSATVPHWRLPRVHLGGGNADDRATMAARDLFEVRSIHDAVNVLTGESDLTAAAELVAELSASGTVTDRVASQFERQIEVERERRAQLTSDRIVGLLARAEILDIDAPHAERARRDGYVPGPQLDALLDDEDVRLQVFEEQRRSELADLLVTLPDRDTARREQVELLIQSGELSAARTALTTRGGGDVRLAVPPTFRWPGWSLADVCRNLTNPDERPPGFEEFVPTDDDVSGWRVVSALHGLWKQEGNAVGEYLASVQALIAPNADAPVIETGLGDETAEFYLPPSPLMQWGIEPVTVAIGRSDASALIRIALSMERDLDGAVLHIADVLSLLRAPDPVTRLEDRRGGFLRIIASQLPVDKVFGATTIGVDARPLPVGAVSQLLHLLGVDMDRADRYALHSMLGAHPYVFWKVVEWMRNRANGQIRLVDLRADPEFDLVVVKMIVRDLASNPAIAVLGTLAEFGERTGATAEELEMLLRSEADELSDKPLPSSLQLVDLVETLDQLVTQRYVEQMDDGRSRVKPEGAWYALRRTYRQGWHEAALLATVRTAQSAFKQHLDAELLRQLLHHWRGQAVEAGVGDERRVLTGIDELRDPDVPVNVQNLLRVVARSYEGPDEVYLGIGIPENSQVTVTGPYVHLAVILTDALRNSWQAIRARGPAERDRPDYVRIDVEVLEDEVVFRITDSGPGFDAETLAAFDSDFMVSSRNGADHGQGLAGYQSFRRHWGMVTLANHEVRGGLVMVRVKRLEDRPPRMDLPDEDSAVR